MFSKACSSGVYQPMLNSLLAGNINRKILPCALNSVKFYCEDFNNRKEGTDKDGKKFPHTPYIRDPDEVLIKRMGKIMKEDLVHHFKRTEREKPLVPKHTDVLIIGGGIMGSAIAYWLKQRAPDSFTVTVVEKDPTYARSSTALSVGGIRQQFSLEENIKLSMFSAEFLKDIKRNLCCLEREPPDICFQPHGYLFLASEAGVTQLQQNHYIQKELGAKVQLLPAEKLKGKFPWLNTEGIAMGSFGYHNEGWFDPWPLLQAFKQKAMFLGAEFVDGDLLGFDFEEKRVNALMDFTPEDTYKYTNVALIKAKDGEYYKTEFAIGIIAAGAETGNFCKKLRIGTGPGLLSTQIPIEPRKRYVYVVHCPDGPGLDFPLVIDPNGTYARREGFGGYYLCGKSPAESEEPDKSNLEVDYSFFENTVWPSLAHRIPAFENTKLKSAWAGFYDYNTFDQNGIIGKHPYYSNIFIVAGFSGHGIQMAPGVGRAVMEMILDGKFLNIDLTRFGLERLFSEEPLLEKNIV